MRRAPNQSNGPTGADAVAREAHDAAFRACYTRHVDALLRFATRCAGPADGEDLVAETFVRAYRSLPVEVLATDNDARAWLFRVLRNLAISASRRHSTAQRKQALLEAGRNIGEPDDGDPELDAAVAALPERQRTVVTLRFIADLDVATAASVMGLTEEAVRALTHRALRTLRRHMGESNTSFAKETSP